MIKTLSIPQELEDFLNLNPDLSPSKLLQSKILEIIENRKFQKAEIIKKDRMIALLQDRNLKFTDIMEKCEKCSSKI